MNAYPIGNDLTVKWSLLYSDGSVFPLSNYDYELSYRTNRGNKVVTDTSVISVDENILTWTFKGDEQVVSGRYTICLKITLSGSKVVELQYDNAFMLSPLSGFKGAGSEIVLQSYCDAIDLKDAVLQARKAMDIAANALVDTANSARDAKAAKAAAEVTAAQAKADAESAKTMAADAKDKVAVAEKAATDASRDAVAAQRAAQTASDHITSLQQAIAELPDGQAVTEKVAEHTIKLTELDQNIDKLLLNGDVIITKLDPSLVWKNGYVGTDGAIVSVQSGTYQFTDPIPVVKGQIVRAIGATGNSVNIISEYNNKIADVAHYLSGKASGQSQIEYTCTDSGYVRLCCKNVGTATFEIISTKNCPAIIPEFSKLNYDIDDIYARLIGGIITKTEVVSTEWVQGYIFTNGSIVPQSSGLYYYSKQISVTKGNIIKFNHVSGQGINVISLYSSAGVYIEGVSYTEQDYSFECSQDGFVRVCCNNKDECEILLTTKVNYHSQNSNLAHIKVAEWNFGVFNNGVSPVGIPDADVNTALPSIKHLLVSLNADILIATECPQYVNRGQTLDTYTTLLEQFFQYHKYGSSSICIFSKYPFAVSDWVSPDGRTYQVGTISIGTTQIGFAAIHPRTAPGSEAKQARITDMQAVISELSDYDKIIVSGDFNTYEDDELDCWRNSGFVLGNCGYFGDINTYPNSSREWYIDNIVTKGFNIDYFNRIEDTASVSDHYPVLAKITSFL